MTTSENRVQTGSRIHTPFYRFAYKLAWILFHSLCPVRYHGEKALNAMDGPYILIANHQSMLDPIVLGAGLPDRELTFLGKKEIMKNPVLSWAVRKLHMIPVDRHNMDMEAMRACMKALKQEEILGIFPEGTRHKAGVMQDLESGTAMIALRSGAPLVPALISRPLRLFRRTECWYCKPIETMDLRENGINKETCEALTKRITETYAAILANPQERLMNDESLHNEKSGT